MFRILCAAAALCCSASALAQNRSADEYTRYELLAPDSASFRIVYDVSAITPGARFFFNPIRKGSVASDESVIDMTSGRPLEFKEVSGAEARESGLPAADLDGRYIRVTLARPVPAGGEARVRIIKTYKDSKSYFREGGDIVFDRPLGIKRNAVVLPPGYEIVSCNIPSQVIEDQGGRLLISFINTYPGQAPLRLRARKLPDRDTAPPRAQPAPERPAAAPRPAPAAAAAPALEPPPMERMRVAERALEDREIVYFLNDPATHSFRLYHDFTETREGTDRYLNVVRRGSRVSSPSATVLDTGLPLETTILRGEAISKAEIDIGEPVQADSEVVVVRFPALRKGETVRIRIEETYTDPSRYALLDGELLWRRSFGRPTNDLVLPDGWYLTTSSVPAVVSSTEDGRIRLSFVNPRADALEVFVKARKRSGTGARDGGYGAEHVMQLDTVAGFQSAWHRLRSNAREADLSVRLLRVDEIDIQ